MKLFNGQNAVVDIQKLVDYCLSVEHPRGRHKARKFASMLGMYTEDASELQSALLYAAQTYDAILTLKDKFGERYSIDFKYESESGSAMVRSCWIIRIGENFPRLTTCYIL